LKQSEQKIRVRCYSIDVTGLDFRLKSAYFKFTRIFKEVVSVLPTAKATQDPKSELFPLGPPSGGEVQFAQNDLPRCDHDRAFEE
jgi:hypothetical protein